MENEVVNQATPMDNNVTYDSLPDELATETQVAVQIENETNADTNAGSSMDNFLNNEYDYNHDEAGSYWVAGGINDNQTQMGFLNTIVNEEMYDEMDLQKYYYDTNLATARAYAAQKSQETAYGFYRAAQEKAIAEGQLTGWYMPAEGQYMLGQYTVAQTKLENPDTPIEDRKKAQRVVSSTEKWFNANQISTRGIKCLGMMNYEENVRHNTIMGELKKQAGDLQRAGNSASAGSYDLELRKYKFQLEEMELASGYDFTKKLGLDDKDFIGHNQEEYRDLQALQGEKSVTDLITKDPERYEQILLNRSRGYVDSVLNAAGIDAEQWHEKYRAASTDKVIESYKDNGYIPDDVVAKYKDPKMQISYKEDIEDIGSDRSIYVFKTMDGDNVVEKCYYKTEDGVFKPLTNKDIKLKGGKTLGESIPNLSDSGFSNINIGSIKDKSTLPGSVTQRSKKLGEGKVLKEFNSKAQQDTIKEQEKKGYKVRYDYESTKGINASVVMENDEGKLIEVSDLYGWVTEIDKKDIRKKGENKATKEFVEKYDGELPDKITKGLFNIGTTVHTDSTYSIGDSYKEELRKITKDGKDYYYRYVPKSERSKKDKQYRDVWERVDPPTYIEERESYEDSKLNPIESKVELGATNDIYNQRKKELGLR